MGLFSGGRRRPTEDELYTSGKNIQVVGGAVIDLTQGKLLAAQRSYPRTLAGGWELPGGKLEKGESHERALARELREELGIKVRVGARVPGEWRLNEHAKMRVYVAIITGGNLNPREHSAIRWLAPSQMNDVRWLINDVAPIRASMAMLTTMLKAQGK